MHKLNIIFLLCFTILFACNQKNGMIKLENGELIYTERVDREVASKLGKYLTEQSFFNNEKKSVKLDLKGDSWQFMMPVKNGAENDEQYTYLLGFFAKQLSRDVFNNAPVDIVLCNNKLESIRVVHFKCDTSEIKAP